MKMTAPTSPTSHFRLSSNKKFRIAFLAGLVVAAVSVFCATNSFAGSITQRLFASAASMMGGATSAREPHANSTAALEFAAAAPTQSSTMSVERRGHTATRLSDGRVLIAGGENSSGALNQSEIYDPASATFSPAANMGAARVDHSATLLADGRVLIAGGRNGGGSLDTTEIFDPAAGAFTSGPSMSVARAGHSATLFANGRVFIAGGEADASAEILDLGAGTSAAAGHMGIARSMHSAALLQDGRVLVVGGRDANGNELSSGEVFDGSAFSTVDSDLKVSRVRAHLRVLFDGKVQIIGGNNDGSMEIYDPAISGFGGYAHVLPESDPCTGLAGQILASQTRAALFHIGHSDPLFDRSGHTITELNGQALVLGGVNGGGAVLSSSSVVASSAASITTDKIDYSPGQIATIRGRGFQPGEVVRVKIHEDPHTPQERGFDATADADGNFSGEYLVQVYDIDMKFIVGARGLTSGATAQTTFTDSNPQLITVGAPTSATVIQGATANYGTVTLQVGGNTNPCSVTFGVNPALPAGATAVFGTNPVTTTGSNVTTTLSVTTTGATPTGTYTFQVTGTNSGAGCQGPGPTASNTLTLIVNSATVNTTTAVTNATATYGDTSVTLNATVTPASGPAVNNGSVTFTVKQGLTTIGAATTDNTVVAGAASVSYALPAGTDAGPYTIEASYTPGSGFNASSGTGTLTINKRAITITADPQTKVYGDADPALTYQITSGSLVVGDTIVGALTRAAGENVGTYAITQGTLAINDGNGGNNYNLTFVGANLTITARPITITADPKSKVYGNADPALTYQITSGSLAFSDTIVGALVRAAGENVGTYAITQGTLAISDGNGGNNYNLTFVGANLTITVRPITITADPKSKVYGNADPALTYQITSGSLAFSDTVVGALVRAAGENVGSYAITQGTLAISDGNGGNNYNLTFVGANLTITARPITITADPKSKTYGDADPALTYQITSGSLAFSDMIVGSLTRAAGENVGTYAITQDTLAISDGNGGNNYNLTFVGANLTITARPITITADPKSKTYGDADPALTYQITSGSLAFSDTIVGALTRAAGQNVGTYAITQGTLAISDGNGGNNYNLTFVGANLTITARPITITADPQTKVYGAADPSLTYQITSGSLAFSDTIVGALTRAPGQNVGTYAITQGTLAISDGNGGNNYNLTFVGANLTITARPITITADPQTKVYGNADPSFTYQITSGSLAFSDTIVGALVRAAGENVGSYAITQGTLAINDGNSGNNYNLTFDGDNLTITARPITITADAKSKTYGNADPALTHQITSGSLAFSDTIVGALTRAPGENVGGYAITQGTLAINDGNGGNNYSLTFVGASLTINKRPLQVTATAGQFKIYGANDPVFAYTITSGTLAFSDTFTGALGRVGGENVGLYAIAIGSLSVSDGNSGNNYYLTLVSSNFEIKKRAITVKADPKTKTFGSPDPVFTYQITVGSLAFTDTFTGALTRDPGELVGTYAIKIGTLAINDGNGGNNYTLTFIGDNLTILTACSVFNGFLSPIGGAVEFNTGGSFADPVRAFKLNSTIPVKFTAICFGAPLTTGSHTLTVQKFSSNVDSDPAIDATPTDAVTTGNQFRLTGTEWHYNLNTKALGGNANGTYLFKATLFDGSSYSVWVSIKK